MSELTIERVGSSYKPNEDKEWKEHVYSSEVKRVEALLAKQDAEIKALKEALEWYADLENYKPGVNWNIDGSASTAPSEIEICGGTRARAALIALNT